MSLKERRDLFKIKFPGTFKVKKPPMLLQTVQAEQAYNINQ